MRHHILAAVVVAWVSWGLSAPSTYASFHEDFEGDLSQWVGKAGGPLHGQIVVDPLRPGNHVLTFSALNNGGDMFGPEIGGAVGQQAVFEFEYLGLWKPGSVADDFGGFVGYTWAADNVPGNVWVGGTQAGYDGGGSHPPVTHLIDDGSWHTYTVAVASLQVAPIRVMLEDWIESGGVPGDAYFDNISVTVVPEPATLSLLILGGLVVLRRR